VLSARTVTVQFPDGPRQILPYSWTRLEGEPDEPNFDIPGYRIAAVCGGDYIAVRDPTCQQA